MSGHTGFVSLYEPFSVDGYRAEWAHGDHTEVVDIRWDNEAWTLSIKVGGADIEAIVRCSPVWDVRQMLLFRDLPEPDLWLGHDGTGRWGEIEGAHRPDLDGAFDVWLPVSTFGRTLPIRRLDVGVGESAAVNALDVDVDTLGVVNRQLRYTRLGTHRWQVEGADTTAQFDVDRFGVPRDLDASRRLA